jgi:hypothetical protein
MYFLTYVLYNNYYYDYCIWSVTIIVNLSCELILVLFNHWTIDQLNTFKVLYINRNYIQCVYIGHTNGQTIMNLTYTCTPFHTMGIYVLG